MRGVAGLRQDNDVALEEFLAHAVDDVDRLHVVVVVVIVAALFLDEGDRLRDFKEFLIESHGRADGVQGFLQVSFDS
jgi:hypothetical protein